MRFLRKNLKVTLISILFLFVASCGGSGGGDFCAFLQFDPVTFDLNGTWTVNEVTSSSNFECDGEVNSYQLEISVSGNTITAFSPDLGTTFTGEISGNQILWSGSFPDGSGTTTVLCAELTANSSTSVSGTSTFDFVEDGFSCSGTTSITATKN